MILRIPIVLLTLLAVLTDCHEVPGLAPPAPPLRASVRAQALAGDGKVQPGEQCDDGNTEGGDGCSSTGTLEEGFLCHIPGQACSLASRCGNNAIDSGEACDDGNTAESGNGCTATCDLSRCGNGVFDNLSYPSYSQELCDDGNRFDGDGCSRLCEVEPGFACAGSPSRCVPSGVVLFNTGVDANNHRLTSGPDPHWLYTGTTTGAATGGRSAGDWPQEIQTARFMAAQGASTCVCQDFLLPAGLNISAFRLRLATFNDNAFSTASVNGTAFTPTLISEPPGQPWQKNAIREFGPTAPWQAGVNRIELCNENNGFPPNAFRYLFVDAYDDRCGDGVLSAREECDDGNTTSSDGCSASCGIEGGYGCYGQPSQCNAGCGDGALGEGEQCDDGNSTAGDGCGVRCAMEAGSNCTGSTSVCTVACGDGIKASTEACDDGNTSNGDGCSAACAVEAGFSCRTAPVSIFLTRRGRTDCTQVSSVTSPALPAAAAQASLSTPGRYRIQYVSGAISFSGGTYWRPGIIGVNFTSGAGPEAFSLGYNPPAPSATRDQAMTLGFGLKEDFEAVSGDVRVASINSDCSLGNTSDTTLIYRVDALPICQQVPVITRTPVNDRPGASFAGSSSPGAAVQVSVDGGTAPVCTATASASGEWTCAAPGLAEGPHSAVAKATVLDTSATSVPTPFTIDLTPPAAPTLTTLTQGATVNVAPDVGGQAEPGSQVTVYEDSMVLCTTTATASGSWSCTPSRPLSPGPHAVFVTATDLAANVSPPSAWRAFTVDAAAPAAPTLTNPLPGQVLAVGDPSIRGTAEPGSTVSVYIDGGTTPICTAVAAENGAWSCTVSAMLAEGTHSLTASATDAVGNTSQGASATAFKVDTQAPDTSITRSPPALALTGEAEFEFSSNEAVVTYECGVDEERFIRCADTYVLLPGVHTLKVRAVDGAGNADPSPAEYTWTVKLPHLAGGGCSVAPWPASWLALLALAVLRQERVRREASHRRGAPRRCR